MDYKKELAEPRALNRAASYCSKAERCEYDMRKKLRTWGASDETTNRVIKRLQDEKFLSDERFCKSFINDKLRFNKWGKTKIIFELRKRNIQETIYLDLFEDVPNEAFDEQLLNILKTKMRSVKGANDYEKKTKLIRFALGRGFAMDAIIKCIDKLMGGNYENMD